MAECESRRTKIEQMKAWIDEASYPQLLGRWRSAPIGSPWFQGEVGDYYAEVIARKRDEDRGRHVAASKDIGWER